MPPKCIVLIDDLASHYYSRVHDTPSPLAQSHDVTNHPGLIP